MPSGVYIRTEEHKRKISKAVKKTFANGRTPWNKGKKMSEEFGREISDRLKGIATRGCGWKMSEGTKRKISEEHIKNREKRASWKGGVSVETTRIRTGIEIRLWREAVFARDNWTCQKCGQRGVELNAHHIKEFSVYPELRFAIDNGRTLCKKCHNKKGLHSWGTKRP
jgi:5-methylcytosine-specific restriction endonuclease McrA